MEGFRGLIRVSFLYDIGLLSTPARSGCRGDGAFVSLAESFVFFEFCII